MAKKATVKKPTAKRKTSGTKRTQDHIAYWEFGRDEGDSGVVAVVRINYPNWLSWTGDYRRVGADGRAHYYSDQWGELTDLARALDVVMTSGPTVSSWTQMKTGGRDGHEVRFGFSDMRGALYLAERADALIAEACKQNPEKAGYFNVEVKVCEVEYYHNVAPKR